MLAPKTVADAGPTFPVWNPAAGAAHLGRRAVSCGPGTTVESLHALCPGFPAGGEPHDLPAPLSCCSPGRHTRPHDLPAPSAAAHQGGTGLAAFEDALRTDLCPPILLLKL